MLNNIITAIDNFFLGVEGRTVKSNSLNGVAGSCEVNEQFNRELDLLINKNLPDDHVFKLGYPDEKYLNIGVENLPIELSAKTLQNKASKNYKRPHPFNLANVKNLPLALSKPIAIFKGSQNRVIVLLDIESDGHNFTAILGIYQPPRGRRKGEKVNSIVSIFPKDDVNEVGRMLNLPVLWKDDVKMSRFNQVHNSCYAEGLNTAHIGAKVVQKNSKVKYIPSKKNTLGSVLYNLFVSKEYKDKGLEGWRDDKEKFKLDLINDIKTFLFTKWKKPWKAGLIFDENGKILSGFRNISGRVYKNGSNVISLTNKSGNSPFFITLSKLESLGGKILDKLKTVWVISYIPIYKSKNLKGDDVAKPDFMLPKFHQVINVDFVEGIKKPTYKTVEFEKLELNEYVEAFINELKRLKRLPKLHYDQADRCYYTHSLLSWDNDSTHLVPINNFKDIEGYYSTLFHEITHSTMNPNRCGRGKHKNADLAYANEELVAEMGAMIICEELGLQYKRQNSLTYLNGWLKQANKKDIDSALIEAYAYACDAADYLLEGIDLTKLVPKTLTKRAEEQGLTDKSKIDKSEGESKPQPKAWEQTKEEYIKQYSVKIADEYRGTGWKRQSEASKKRINKLLQAKEQALLVHKEVVAKEFAKGADIPAKVLRDYPELKLSDIDKTIEQLIANAEPFRTVELTNESYGKEFENGHVNTPIGKVRIDKAQIHKLIRKARVKFFGLIKPTLEKPLIIVTSKDDKGKEREAFIKTFTDGATIFFVSFVKTDSDLVVVSNHSRREGQIKKILSEGNITYPQDSITALSGLPNITEPSYKTLLIGLRLKSLGKDNQKLDQSQQKPKLKQETLTNPIDIFIHKAGSTFRGIPKEELKAFLSALTRLKDSDEWERFNEDGTLDFFDFTAKETDTLGIPDNYDRQNEPKTSLLTTQNYFGSLKLSKTGETILAAYEKFASKKENLKPVKTGQLMLFGVGDVNEQFNKELDLLIKGKLPKNHVFYLGDMGDILNALSIKILPIEMQANRLYKKANQKNHLFDLALLKNLPEKLNNPIMVFNSKTVKGSLVVLIELVFNDNNFVVAIEISKLITKWNREDVRINDVRSIYPKDTITDVLNWIENDGLLLWVDKKKALDLLVRWRSNYAKATQQIKGCTNIIQNFENPKITPIHLNGNSESLFGLQPISSTKKGKTYRLNGDLGQFLGEYDRNNYSIVLRGEKGAGKSRLLFQLINAFAEKKHRVAFLSLEMALNSSITQRYKNEYINGKNLKNIDITDQSPTYGELSEICKRYDVVAIDSWTKLKGFEQSDFDRLQKENPQTIIICIFQSTTGKVTRGGNMPEYDAGTVIQVNKGGLAECEKNRYAPTDKIYNVFNKKLEITEDKAND